MATITPAVWGSPNPGKFLDMLAFSEGTSTESITQNDGYDVIVTGEDAIGQHVHQEVFTDYSTHPRKMMIIREGPPLLESDAAGRYQLLGKYFTPYCEELGLHDFSPISQDLIAIAQIREHRDGAGNTALKYILAGDITTAIAMTCKTWASLPGNSYGQGGKTLQQLLDYYLSL